MTIKQIRGMLGMTQREFYKAIVEEITNNDSSYHLSYYGYAHKELDNRFTAQEVQAICKLSNVPIEQVELF